MDLIYIVIIIFLLILLYKKQFFEFLEKIKIKCFFGKAFKIIYNFIYKVIEVFWMLVLGLVILLPIFVYYSGKEIFGISYNEYKELLDITLNSYYVIVIGVIIIVYLFRNQLKKKIEQLSEFNQNGVKFDHDTQTAKNMQNSSDMGKNIKNDDSVVYEIKENIYEEIKENFTPDKEKNNINKNLQEENEHLRQHIEELENKIKLEKFVNIQNSMARTTNIVLLYINSKYKYNNSFEIAEIKNVLKEVSNIKVNLRIETMVVYQFLKRNNIIDCEEENKFSVNEYGMEFLKFLFEGGK